MVFSPTLSCLTAGCSFTVNRHLPTSEKTKCQTIPLRPGCNLRMAAGSGHQRSAAATLMYLPWQTSNHAVWGRDATSPNKASVYKRSKPWPCAFPPLPAFALSPVSSWLVSYCAVHHHLTLILISAGLRLGSMEVHRGSGMLSCNAWP